MTNSATIQARIFRGYGIVGKILGQTYQFYRRVPSDTNYDVSGETWDDGYTFDEPGAATFSLPVSLNAEDMKYSKPRGYAKATWYALVDGTNLEAGDYFVGPQGTFFVAGLQLLLPILVVQCNRTVSVFRPQRQTGVGIGPYGGNTDVNDTKLAFGLPCSILQGTKGEKTEAGLPGDVRSPWHTVLMPQAGLALATDDILIDDLARRMVISSVELTALGYRLSCMQALP